MTETGLIYQENSLELGTEPSTGHDLLCIFSSLNNAAFWDCHEAQSRRLSEASEI